MADLARRMEAHWRVNLENAAVFGSPAFAGRQWDLKKGPWLFLVAYSECLVGKVLFVSKPC